MRSYKSGGGRVFGVDPGTSDYCALDRDGRHAEVELFERFGAPYFRPSHRPRAVIDTGDGAMIGKEPLLNKSAAVAPPSIPRALSKAPTSAMPRIKASSADAKIKPREFALWRQLSPGSDGEVDKQMLRALLSKYAPGKPECTDELTFEHFSTLLNTSPTKADNDAEGGDTVGWAASDNTSPLKPWRFTRRQLLPTDVRIQITHAGICHSDLHQIHNDWGAAQYPMIPGHEIAGVVTEVGARVTKHKVGDRVGIGCMVNSCQECDACVRMKEEQFCHAAVYTYNAKDIDGTITYGGYSTQVLVHENFVLRVPDALPLEKAAPLLCAGITTFSPIRTYGFDKPGLKIGVVGLGGLGHMAVQFLKAFGVETTIISTSPGKKEEALNVLKADHFLVSKDEAQMKAAFGTLDGLINTVSAKHDLSPLMSLMKPDGTCVMLGLPPASDPMTLPSFNLISRRQRVVGSPIGGIAQTQECLDFCAKNGITCVQEVIAADYINEALQRLKKNDVRYRFVIDIQGSLIN